MPIQLIEMHMHMHLKKYDLTGSLKLTYQNEITGTDK
jgi:hypothetical protein